MGKDQKPVAIFYDCCIPRPDFERVIFEHVPFAEHIFVQDIFRPKICHSDPHLFLHVWLLSQSRYQDRACFFVTIDRRFVKKVELKMREKRFAERVAECLKARQGQPTPVYVVTLGHCGSREFSARRVWELVRGLKHIRRVIQKTQ